MVNACRRQECTVAQTGICLLNNDPAKCPERLEDVDNVKNELLSPGASVLTAPIPKQGFPASLTLSQVEVNEIMCARCCHIVGILGAPNAGKTASLVSLYLLLGRASLVGYEFCDSRTLMAFEQISRGARRWNNGNPPEQMTEHTKLADERTAGFLHLRLRHTDTGIKFDIFLPDLPGEWSTSLVDTNRIDRLDFLKSVDTIWLMLDGRELMATDTRMHATSRAKIMMQRIATFLKPTIPNVTFVITHLDLGKPTIQTLNELKQAAADCGIRASTVHIASFADKHGVDPGTGISQLLDSVISSEMPVMEFWADNDDHRGHRAMLRFRESGESI